MTIGCENCYHNGGRWSSKPHDFLGYFSYGLSILTNDDKFLQYKSILQQKPYELHLILVTLETNQSNILQMRC